MKLENERRWGEGGIDLKEKSLPSLKAKRALDDVLNLPDGARVLDYGCGEGKLLTTISALRGDLRLFGMDVQAPLNVNTKFQFRSIKGDQNQIPEEKFDRILSLDVLEHVPDLDQTLRMISNLLEAQGRFILFVPMEGEAFSPFGFYRWILGADLYMKTKSHAQAYRRKQFLIILNKYFEVEKMSFSYHALGTLLDSTFFALCGVLKSLENWFWKENSLYRPENKNKGLLNRAMEYANFLCFFESKFLAKFSFLASGLHITARKRI